MNFHRKFGSPQTAHRATEIGLVIGTLLKVSRKSEVSYFPLFILQSWVNVTTLARISCNTSMCLLLWPYLLLAAHFAWFYLKI